MTVKTIIPVGNIQSVFPYVRSLNNSRSFKALSQRMVLIILLFGCRRISDLCHLSIEPRFSIYQQTHYYFIRSTLKQRAERELPHRAFSDGMSLIPCYVRSPLWKNIFRFPAE